MSRSRYKITNQQAPHFVTFTVLHWIPVFTRVETVNILLDSLKFLSMLALFNTVGFLFRHSRIQTPVVKPKASGKKFYYSVAACNLRLFNALAKW